MPGSPSAAKRGPCGARSPLVLLAVGLLLALGANRHTRGAEPDGFEFFERQIRPLLIARCYECHSAASQPPQGGLRLDTRDTLRHGGRSGPAIVPGDPAKSAIVRVIHDSVEKSRGLPAHRLSAGQLANLETWIRLGAPDPRGEPISNLQSPISNPKHWAFLPLRDPPPPAGKNQRWPATDIDSFILARLESNGRRPAIAADKRALLRRATFDLTGLPPTPAEIEAFLHDRLPEAFAKVLDRLLAAPQYGERWGRHWLDLVRYGDTAGDSADYPIPQAVRYRDYVIDSFNRDKPYDQFVREQIAGDLLPAANEDERREHLIATGFIACSRRFGVAPEGARHLTIEDTLDTLGRVFLGLSLSCARCHDHKYDPIPTRDYYALYGIFDSTRYPHAGSENKPHQEDFVPLLPLAEANALLQPHRTQLAQLDAERAGLVQKKVLLEKEGFNTGEVGGALAQLEEKREKLVAHAPAIETVYAVAEGRATNAHVQLRGEPDKLGDEVPRGFLQILGGPQLPKDARGSGRLELAGWLATTNNPLLARVMVNRIWQHHFGRGLVATPSDFGTRGQPPSHPQLLDYLAARFVESGWSVKAMHQLIMLSSVYQQSSVAIGPGVESDPGNELLGRFARRRLDAEEIRDALLYLSGDLDFARGGPHPFPPEKEWEYTQHTQFTDVYESNQRSVYLMQQRLKRHPFLAVFDGADANTSTATRETSVTPLQALFALNNKFVHEQSGKFAARLLRERGEDRERIDLAHQLAFGRPARPDEIAEALAYLARFREQLKSINVGAEKRGPMAWASYARAVLGSNEFLFVD